VIIGTVQNCSKTGFQLGPIYKQGNKHASSSKTPYSFRSFNNFQLSSRTLHCGVSSKSNISPKLLSKCTDVTARISCNYRLRFPLAKR
jgi:hypothetical protein